MMNILDLYPETLRDMHDTILDALAGDQVSEPAAAASAQVIEWIRQQWGGRTLTRRWWGIAEAIVGDQGTPLLIDVSGDPVISARGRELRAAAWAILAATGGWQEICRVATTIAVTVEAEWTRTAIYIPKGEDVARAIRDAAVWRQFGGLSTVDNVIAQHKLSQRQIYAIARRVQDDRDLREQPPLPGT